MTDIGEEHQSRMCQLEHLLVKSLQFIVTLSKLFIKTSFEKIVAEHKNRSYDNQHNKQDQS